MIGIFALLVLALGASGAIVDDPFYVDPSEMVSRNDVV